MTRSTSINALREISASGLLGKMQLEVYSALEQNGPCTANELFQFMERSCGPVKRNQANITTRLGELRDRGVAEEVNRRECSVTKMTVTVWDVTGNLPKKIAKAKEPTKNHLLNSLCVQVEYMLDLVAASKNPLRPETIKWVEVSKNLLDKCDKYRGSE